MCHRNMVRKISAASFFLFFLFFGFATAKQANTETPDFLYGLYYADWDREENALSLVISADDRPIPPKANDPGAPTQPGFYLHDQHLRFQLSRLSMGHFSFRTQKLSGKSFSFDATLEKNRLFRARSRLVALDRFSFIFFSFRRLFFRSQALC